MEKISQDKLLRFSWALMFALLGLIVLFVTALPEQKDTINSLTLSVRDMFILIIGYWFGSSKGSADKNALLENKIDAAPSDK